MRWNWGVKLMASAASAAVLAYGGLAWGNITVAWYRIQPDPAGTTGVNILAANGWSCYLLVATADAASGTVGGWDLSTPNSPLGGNTFNHTGHNWGIFNEAGEIAQRWPVDVDTGALMPSNYGIAPTLVGSPADGFRGTLALRPDSFFFTSPNFAQSVTPSEDNNLLNGSNPPYNRNPVPDNTGALFDTGVGSFMKAAGTVQAAHQVQSQVIAQVWVPSSGIFDFFNYPQAYGVVTDGTPFANLYFFTVGPPIPEPGTAGMLGVGLAMLMRRGRREGRRGR